MDWNWNGEAVSDSEDDGNDPDNNKGMMTES